MSADTVIYSVLLDCSRADLKQKSLHNSNMNALRRIDVRSYADYQGYRCVVVYYDKIQGQRVFVGTQVDTESNEMCVDRTNQVAAPGLSTITRCLERALAVDYCQDGIDKDGMYNFCCVV